MPGRPSIHVFRLGHCYVARLVLPHAAGDASPDTIPTAFTSDADPLAVLRAVARDNPHADVALAPVPDSDAARTTGC